MSDTKDRFYYTVYTAFNQSLLKFYRFYQKPFRISALLNLSSSSKTV